MVEGLESIFQSDYKLYQHFKDKLNRSIEAFGRDKMRGKCLRP